MKFKILEIRDEATCIPAMAIKMEAENSVQDYYLHRRSGYPRDGSGIILMHLGSQRATVDPYDWGSLGYGPRTMPYAHNYIEQHFEKLEEGDVVDVRVILGEKQAPARSERFDVV